MDDRVRCLACDQLLPSSRLLCANCWAPIGKRDRWTHDAHMRAVHKDCQMPTGYPPIPETK